MARGKQLVVLVIEDVPASNSALPALPFDSRRFVR